MGPSGAPLTRVISGNGYIVGINQIYDVEIDSVNKPFLPIASGELSPKLAWFLCIGLAGLGVSLASIFGPMIAGLYAFGLILGTVYRQGGRNVRLTPRYRPS